MTMHKVPLWRRVLCRLLGVPVQMTPPRPEELQPGDLIIVAIDGRVVHARVVEGGDVHV